jgi:type IV pilus assembly protein PilV
MKKNKQCGFMLIEALVGIFIFSIGVLAVVAMQGHAIGQVSDAKYRIDASFLANEIIGQIWVDRANIGAYAFPGGSAAGLAAWTAKVDATLPGTAANPPTIAVDAATGQVTVTVRWQAPKSTAPSQHMATSIIADP